MKKNKLNLKDTLEEVITKEEISQIARETQFVQRKSGVIKPLDFLFTLMFRVSATVPASLDLLTLFLNTTVSKVGLHKRFNKYSVIFMRTILQQVVLKRIAKKIKLTINGLDEFTNLFIIDSSSWDISEEFKLIFPGCGGSASDANCKLQFCYDYLTGEIYIYDEKPGKNPDQGFSINILKLINPGSLFMFDLGYWKFETFYGINAKGGHFLSRLNNTVNLYIKKGDEYIKVEIENILDCGEHDNISVDEIYLKKGSQYLKVRLVGFKLPEEESNKNRMELCRRAKNNKKTDKPKRKSLILAGFSVYITNAPEEIIADEMVRSYYRLRWNVELIFKSFKSVLQIHESNVISNKYRLLCELYARLILIALVHRIFYIIDSYMFNKDKKELSLDKFWKYIDAEKGELCNAILKSWTCFTFYIEKKIDEIMIKCEKCHQKKRKTTRELILHQIGDAIPIKIEPYEFQKKLLG